MNNVHKIMPVFVFAAVFIFANSVLAESEQAVAQNKPLVLRTVMKKLGQDMQATTGAISTEDWALVATLAPKIASHAEPPLTEKIHVFSWLGSNAGKFRGLDHQVHEAASAMGEAAKRNDGQAVIASFAKVQQGCLNCHQSFRKSFMEHFYEK